MSMTHVRLATVGLAFGLVLLVAATARPAASAPVGSRHASRPTPLVFKNCTNLNRRWRHGVGLPGARDRTSGRPVTNFFRSRATYSRAMSFNRRLDRDRDGIACEKR